MFRHNSITHLPPNHHRQSMHTNKSHNPRILAVSSVPPRDCQVYFLLSLFLYPTSPYKYSFIYQFYPLLKLHIPRRLHGYRRRRSSYRTTPRSLPAFTTYITMAMNARSTTRAFRALRVSLHPQLPQLPPRAQSLTPPSPPPSAQSSSMPPAATPAPPSPASRTP